MEPISIGTLSAALGKRCADESVITKISTDSRDIEPGCVFVCIEGERFDGHDFAREALERGAGYVVARKPVAGADPARVFYVDNTLDANIRLAGVYRRMFHPLCVGVTGSVGKTTTKEFIACVLAERFRTLKTPGNRNNEIGVPATLCEIGPQTGALVVEMGMNARGDVDKLGAAALPDIAVVTWVGTSHIELLGSRENILEAKLEIARHLPPGAPLLLCADNDLLGKVREAGKARIVRYGIDTPGADIRATEITQAHGETAFTIHARGESYRASIPAFGRHNVLDALAAFGVGLEAGLWPEEILRGLSSYEPSGMRQKIVERGGVTVVEDCYNASPDSMAAALRAFRDWDVRGRRIAVLGDMLELGETAPEAHRAVGRLCAQEGIDLLLCVGEYARELAGDAGRAFESKRELVRALLETVREGDVVWFKASRGVKLEEAVEAFYQGREDN